VLARWEDAAWRFSDPFGREWRCRLLPRVGRGEEPGGESAGPAAERERDAREKAGAAVFQLVAFAFDSMGATDEGVAGVMLAIYDALTGQSLGATLPGPGWDPDRRLQGFAPVLRETLVGAAEEGILRFDEVPAEAWAFTEVAKDSSAAPSASPQPLVEEVTTWIDIELKDTDGNPVGGARYVVGLPNGTTREGVLDDHGKARVDGIDPGTCTVSFPEFDPTYAGGG
jgi:hypothetical protein